ncbi:hypothetical protein RFI_02995, partial [Reticulomyxa filosa]
ISVFDLNTFQFIQHDTLPTSILDLICYHCFVSNPENGQVQEIAKMNQEKNKQNYQMLLFKENIGLSIKYNEDNNTFQFHQLTACGDVALDCCAYVCINDIILFFGDGVVYLFQKQCTNSTCVHIIGGKKNFFDTVSTHMETEVSEWLSEEEMKKGVELKVKKADEEKKENEIDKIVKKEKDEQQNKMKKDTNVGHALKKTKHGWNGGIKENKKIKLR